MRSDEVKKGHNRAPHRSLLRATGLKDEDFNKPFIGVANSFIEVIPGHFFLDKVSDIIKDEIKKQDVFHLSLIQLVLMMELLWDMMVCYFHFQVEN